MGSRNARGFTLFTLLSVVAGLLVVAFGVPIASALVVNQSRVARATRDLETIVDAARQLAVRDDERVLFVGVGEPPKPGTAVADNWRATRTSPLSTVIPGTSVTADPWGNYYTLVHGTALTWGMSAGANGVIESPLAQSHKARIGGDDIIVVVHTGERK